jgi:hypothetical protein
VSFLKLIVIDRLPVALIPPFNAGQPSRSGFSLWDFRRKEGLTRWGVALKYPGLVLKNMWPTLLMALLSAVLLAGMLAAAITYRRDWRRMAWIVIPWLLTVSALSFAKQIEPRNLSPIIVPEVAGVAFLVTRLRGGRKSLLAVNAS